MRSWCKRQGSGLIRLRSGFTGTAFGSAVIPIALCLRVHWANRQACIAGAVVGFLGAMAAWFLTAWKVFGEVSVATTGQTYPQLAGNLGGLIVSGLVCFIWSLLSPENYDFAEMRAKTFVRSVLPPLWLLADARSRSDPPTPSCSVTDPCTSAAPVS